MAIQTNHSTESLKPDSGVLAIDATGALALPAGAETDRPLGAAAGHIRFDQTSTKPEYFDGSVWDKITSKTYVDAGDQNLQNQINNILSNIDPVALDSLTEIVNAFQNSDGSLTDAITALSVSLNTALTQEILDRTTADTALQNNIDAEALARTTADDLLQDNIDAEELARIAGDTTLQTNLDAEALARTAGDTTLQTNLNTVEANLQAQINSILSNLDPAALDSLTEIVNAFQNADTGLLASINNLIAQTTADLNQERIERIAADAAETAARITDDAINAAAINVERDRALAAEEVLQDNIDAETLARIAGDTTLQNNLDAVELDLQGQIDAEILARTTADTALQNNLDAVELDLQGQIDAEALARTTADDLLQDNIDAEALARTTADDLLQDNIDAEALARTTADNQLQDNIDAEALARTTADNQLQANIDTLELDLQANIDAEALARTTADTQLQNNLDAVELSLQNNIDAEALARTTADTQLQNNLDAVELSLQNNLDAEALARTTADDLLQDNIDAEALARTTADNLLQTNINNEELARIAGDQDVRDYVDNLIDQTENTINALSLDSLTDVQVTTAPTDGQNLTFDSTIGLFRPKTNALAPITRSFVGDGLNMEFDIIDSVPSPNNLVVVINGIAQQPFYSYTVVDGTRLLFDEAPEANDIIEVRVLKGSATTDRPRPVVSNIAYSTIATFNVVTFNATDITYGTGAKIGNVAIQRIDYPTPNAMQLMFEHSFTSGLYDLTLIDTSGNETVYPNLIRIGGGAEWTDSVQFIGSFSGGDPINFSVGVNSGSTLTLGAVASGETTPSWLSVSGLTIVGTAPVNSSPTRYEFKVTANNSSVNITRHYWLVVV